MTKLASLQQLVDGISVPGMAIAVAAVDPEWGGTTQYIFSTKDPKLSDGSVFTVSASTVFEIASVTKTFTAAMYLNRLGNFGGALGDQVKLPLPNSVLGMTIQSLANYTSGFPSDNYSDFGSSARNSLKELCNWFTTKFPPAAKPVSNCGTVYSYSNLAFDLLSFAAINCQAVVDNDEVIGMYSTQLSAMLSKFSLNLPDTRLYDPSIIPSLPLGFSGNKNRPFPPNAYAGRYDPISGAPMDFGSGGMVSTAQDMAQWLLWNMGQAGANQGLAIEMQQPTWALLPYSGVGTDIVSSGWFLGRVPPDTNYIWKNGAAAAFTSWIGFQQWPDLLNPSPSGCVVLAAGQQADAIGFQAIEILLGASTPGTLRKGPGRNGFLQMDAAEAEP